jgi:hypothetical protein
MYCKPATQTRGSQPPRVDGGGVCGVLYLVYINIKISKKKKNKKFIFRILTQK